MSPPTTADRPHRRDSAPGFAPGPALGLATSLVISAVGCRQEPPPQVPDSPPEALEALAEERQEGSQVEFPAAREPTRRGPCGIPMAVSMEGLMKPNGIRRIQQKLEQEGLLASGEYRPLELDAATLRALLEFQRQRELPAVGLPTYGTVRALGLELPAVFLTGGESCEGAGP